MTNPDFITQQIASTNENNRRAFLKNSALTLTGLLVLHAFGCKTEKLERKEGALMVDMSPEILEKIEFFEKSIESFSSSQVSANRLCAKLNGLKDFNLKNIKEVLMQDPKSAQHLQQTLIEYPAYSPDEQVFIATKRCGIILWPGDNGEQPFTPFKEVSYDGLTFIVINKSDSHPVGTVMQKPFPNIPSFIVLNISTIRKTYNYNIQTLHETDLSYLKIDLPRYFVAILEQEALSLASPDKTERDSELPTARIAGQFWMVNRVTDASFAANPEHSQGFKDRLDRLESEGYRKMYKKYGEIFKNFTPKYIPQESNRTQDETIRAIKNNPGILTYMCKQVLSEK